jgi:hypothetical protein
MPSPSLLLSALLALAAPSQFENNLLVNGDARRDAEGWKAYGLATVERFLGEPCFSVRYKGSFLSLRRSQSEVLCGNGLGDITAEGHFCDAAAVFVSPGCGRHRCHSIKSLERT